MSYKRAKRAFVGYYILVLASVMAFDFAGRNSMVMYAGYVLSLVFFLSYFIAYVNRIDGEVFFWGIAISIGGLISAVTHSDHIFESFRLLGLNINIFVPLVYSIILGILCKKKMSQALIEEIMESYAKICLFVIAITVALNINSIGRIFSPSSNAYLVALRGFFPNKNMFGDFSSMATIISIYLYITKRKKLYLFSAVICAVVTVFSFCRAALLFLGIFSFLFFITPLGGLKSRQEKKRLMILRKSIIVAVILLVILLSFNTSIQRFVFGKVLRIEVGDAGRTGIQSTAYNLIRNNGILEYLFGFGASELEYTIPYDLHNTYLSLLFTGGVVKVFLFLFGLYISLKHILSHRNSLLSRFCLCCLISYLSYSFFETVVYFEFGLFSFDILFLILFVPLSCDFDSLVPAS